MTGILKIIICYAPTKLTYFEIGGNTVWNQLTPQISF